MVVALGPRGTGKTALLEAMRTRCQPVPHAYLDFERFDDDVTPIEVLGRLAFNLSSHRPQFGRLAFPRLALCLLVVGSSADSAPGDRRAALAKLPAIMDQNKPMENLRGPITELLDLVGMLTDDQNLRTWAGALTPPLFRGLRLLRRRRLVKLLGPMPRGEGKAEDVLANLARADLGDDGDRAEATALCCLAFLSDLRWDYAGVVTSRRRTLNPAIFLDNVHTTGGMAFLDALRHARVTADEPDPLVVVATSRTWEYQWDDGWHPPGTWRDPHGSARPTPRVWAEVEADWTGGGAHNRWGDWYLVKLGSLPKPSDTSDLALEHLGARPSTAVNEFVHRLSCGHPGAAVDIFGVLGKTVDRSRLTGLRQVLEWRVTKFSKPGAAPENAHPTLIEHVRAQVKKEFSQPGWDHLVTVGAARDIELFFQPDVLPPTFPGGDDVVLQTLADNLWLREVPEEGESVFEIDPWLRRILLHELAERDGGDLPDWSSVHTTCRDFYDRNGRVVSARYHDMALENLAEVVAYLSRPFGARHAEFDVPTAEKWLSDLDVITAAPNRLRKDEKPFDQVQKRVGQWSTDLENTLAWLVVSLWVTADALGDPGKTLHATIAAEYRKLAAGRGRGSLLLFERAKRYK